MNFKNISRCLKGNVLTIKQVESVKECTDHCILTINCSWFSIFAHVNGTLTCELYSITSFEDDAMQDNSLLAEECATYLSDEAARNIGNTKGQLLVQIVRQREFPRVFHFNSLNENGRVIQNFRRFVNKGKVTKGN